MLPICLPPLGWHDNNTAHLMTTIDTVFRCTIWSQNPRTCVPCNWHAWRHAASAYGGPIWRANTPWLSQSASGSVHAAAGDCRPGTYYGSDRKCKGACGASILSRRESASCQLLADQRCVTIPPCFSAELHDNGCASDTACYGECCCDVCLALAMLH